jgi:hypothetical protein
MQTFANSMIHLISTGGAGQRPAAVQKLLRSVQGLNALRAFKVQNNNRHRSFTGTVANVIMEK